MSSSHIVYSEEVADARSDGRPIVALETTLVTHGLPQPHNLAAAARAEAAVRGEGAVPATIGVLEGRLIVGMTAAELARLIDSRPRKLAARDLAAAMADRASGGATVSATLHAAQLAGIQIFATGGIGGVHPELRNRPDISSDLGAIARTSALVVSAGAKAILDLAATLEVVEALGVPVWGFRTSELPAFYVAKSGITLDGRVDSPQLVAERLHLKWRVLGQPGGILLMNPPPPHPELTPARVRAAIDQAQRLLTELHVHGPATTPFLLGQVAALLGPPALEVNAALVESNAQVAASVAVALKELSPQG